jgi:hypothetical protein
VKVFARGNGGSICYIVQTTGSPLGRMHGCSKVDSSPSQSQQAAVENSFTFVMQVFASLEHIRGPMYTLSIYYGLIGGCKAHLKTSYHSGGDRVSRRKLHDSQIQVNFFVFYESGIYLSQVDQ